MWGHDTSGTWIAGGFPVCGRPACFLVPQWLLLSAAEGVWHAHGYPGGQVAWAVPYVAFVDAAAIREAEGQDTLNVHMWGPAAALRDAQKVRCHAPTAELAARPARRVGCVAGAPPTGAAAPAGDSGDSRAADGGGHDSDGSAGFTAASMPVVKRMRGREDGEPAGGRGWAPRSPALVGDPSDALAGLPARGAGSGRVVE